MFSVPYLSVLPVCTRTYVVHCLLRPTQVRVFRFKTGKLFSVFDEGLEIHKEQQQVGAVGVFCVYWACLMCLVGVLCV